MPGVQLLFYTGGADSLVCLKPTHSMTGEMAGY